jgi:hypothetical protein
MKTNEVAEPSLCKVGVHELFSRALFFSGRLSFIYLKSFTGYEHVTGGARKIIAGGTPHYRLLL